MDYRFTFTDEAQWWELANANGWVQYEYEPQPPTPFNEPQPEPIVKNKWIAYPDIDFVVIGTVYEPLPPTPPDEPPPTPVPYPGYGVNIRFNNGSVLPSNLVSYVVEPANPQFTFAGGWEQGAI
jgi:hypothetical protein